MQTERFYNMGITEGSRPALEQVYGPQASMSINKSGAARKAFSHVVYNANGSKDMIITLNLGSRCFKQVIHVSAPNEQHEPCGHEEMLELEN